MKLAKWGEFPIVTEFNGRYGLIALSSEKDLVSLKASKTKVTVTENGIVKAGQSQFDLNLVAKAIQILETLESGGDYKFYTITSTNCSTGEQDDLLLIRRGNLTVLIAPLVEEERTQT